MKKLEKNIATAFAGYFMLLAFVTMVAISRK